jgi:IS5 family transposase
VLRCALLKQYRQLSYEELAFHLEDSASFRAFARLPFGCNPKKSVLHRTIGRLRAETFEAINRTLLASAAKAKLEDGKLVRIDSTVTAAAIHPPSDSSLLHDAVRVTVRLSKAARRIGARLPRHTRDHRRAAKARLRVIEYTRSREKRRAAYRDLVKITRASLRYLEEAASALAGLATAAAERWRAEAADMRPLIERAIEQTERRVFRGEAVPAADKVVSLFEPHADIIIKGGRDVAYGHKLNLTTGKSGLILDLVVEDGNPADSERLVPMLERHIAIYGKPPRRRRPMAAMPVATISPPPRRSASATWRSTKSAGSPSRTWSRAAGSTAGSGTSAPASRRGSPASSAASAWRAALGGDSPTSRPTSGPPPSPTISPCSSAS